VFVWPKIVVTGVGNRAYQREAQTLCMANSCIQTNAEW